MNTPAVTWRKRVIVRLLALGSREGVKVIPRGFRGEQNGVLV